MSAEPRGRPVFSVVTIFHNEERFLAEAVASVANQTGVSWELILVDDGSTDQSSRIARDLATGLAGRARFVTHPDGGNRGMSAARNLGVEHAGGEFVTFLDADDVWLPGKLADQLLLLRRHPEIDVLVAPAEWWRSWDGDDEGRDHRQQLVDVPGHATVVTPPTLARNFLVDEWRSICDLVVARSLFEQLGGYTASFGGMFEDQVFHTKLLSRHRAVVCSRHWYRYRQHPAACTATSHESGTHVVARRRFLDWALEHLVDGSAPPETDPDDWATYIDLVRHQRRLAQRDEVRQRVRRRLASLLKRPRPELQPR